MDLNDFLNNSAILLKKEEMAAIIGPDEKVYHQLIDLSFSREMPVCWRAAWMADYLAELHPRLAEGYIYRAWKEIGKKHPDGVTRSTLRMLCRYDIPEKYQGVATDLCLDWLITESVPVAIKAFSMEILLKIARIYPDLRKEFITVMEDQAPYNSVGFRARASMIIKEMNKL